MGAGARRRGRWARGRALGARQAGARRAGRAAWAPGLALGCALGLFSIRFDSVLFLSQFLDIVREPGSLTLFISKIFEKKNIIN